MQEWRYDDIMVNNRELAYGPEDRGAAIRSEDWDRFSLPARHINRAFRLLTRLGDGRLRGLGFSVGQLPVLVSLKNGAALSQKELARIAQIEQPSMAQILSRMERDGLIQRVPDPADGRSSLITLTELAASRFPEARGILLRGHKEALAGFREEEIQTLTELLERVISNLENTLQNFGAEDEKTE